MATKRPNILFFFTDDQRFDTIAAGGNEAVRTPTLDRLVERGLTFTHAHIPCGTSGAVCMPSRAMLHSGRTLFHLAGAGQRIPVEHITLGQTFREAGYRTFGTGKWHNGPESYHRSFSHGDEIFFGGMADHWNVPAFHYDPTGAYDQALRYVQSWQTDNTVSYRRADHVNCGTHSSEMIADAAIDFLGDSSGDVPFLMYLSFLAPHDPRTMPEQFRQLYDPGTIELPANFTGGHPFDTGALHIRDEMLAGFPRTPAEVRRHIAEYYAMISHLDHEIGRVLEVLEARGLAQDTIVVFGADNGLAVGQHGLMGKQNCYEHSVRVPLVFCGPGIPSGQRTTAYAYMFDVYPTLCELAGLDVPGSVEGTSLTPAFENPEWTPRESLYFAYTDTQRAVKDGRFKLIEYVIEGQRTMTQLFDLDSDPWELTNLAGDRAFAEVRERLGRELRRWRDAWDDRESEWGERFWRAFPTG